MERRQQQAAVAQVLGPVEQQDRSLSEDRAEQRVRLAGVQLAARALEYLHDGGGIEHHHEALVEQRAHRDDVAVAAAAGVEEASATQHEADGLHPAGQGRSRGQRGGAPARGVGGGGGHVFA